MNRAITIVFCLYTFIAIGQSDSELYRFSEDILSQIDKDTVPWKYQIGATALSFSGYYREVLQIWDKNGVRKPKTTEQDSLFFMNSKKVNAKDYIIKQSKNAQIVIINEAHHMPKHRIFTKSLLKELYANGYRYLGLEALFDSTINVRKYPIIESGYYTKEPEFGNLLSEALDIGFTLFGYEVSSNKNGKEREIEQAQNIQKFIESVPAGKVLIHCGFAHAYENDYPAWEKAMAGRLKEYMKIDPLTIDQTMFLERSNSENNHLFIELNNTNEPIVLINENEQVFNGNINQTDIVVIHPPTTYVNNRPNWLIDGKKGYTIPPSKIKNNESLIILAYRMNEFDNDGIPADIIEITDNHIPNELYLTKGSYTIVIKNKKYNIIDKYEIEVK
ncbi:MAG: hypothetical protein LC107_09910 [Chitinophagales bacterium]|nr:hypothetical protein [Chitinophagales bacterium]